jgi:hypothetical protein
MTLTESTAENLTAAMVVTYILLFSALITSWYDGSKTDSKLEDIKVISRMISTIAFIFYTGVFITFIACW